VTLVRSAVYKLSYLLTYTDPSVKGSTDSSVYYVFDVGADVHAKHASFQFPTNKKAK